MAIVAHFGWPKIQTSGMQRNLYLKKNIIKNATIAYGGMSAIPKRALNCEISLLNKEFSEKNINIAQKSLEKDFNPIDDMRASSKYRMKIAKIEKKQLIKIIINYIWVDMIAGVAKSDTKDKA